MTPWAHWQTRSLRHPAGVGVRAKHKHRVTRRGCEFVVSGACGSFPIWPSVKLSRPPNWRWHLNLIKAKWRTTPLVMIQLGEQGFKCPNIILWLVHEWDKFVYLWCVTVSLSFLCLITLWHIRRYNLQQCHIKNCLSQTLAFTMSYYKLSFANRVFYHVSLYLQFSLKGQKWCLRNITHLTWS